MSEPTYRALLIGNSTFPDDERNLPPLLGPVNDLPTLRDALTDGDTGLFEAANVRLLPERSKRDITTAMEEFFRAADRDHQLLLYYSGHGKQDLNGNLYLCARDTRTDYLIATGISDTEINGMINASAASAVVLVLDCCYSGSFKGSIPPNLKGEGRFLITSCRATQLANDSPHVSGASPFTGHLAEGLLLGTLDSDHDGYVALNDVYGYVFGKLRELGQFPERHFGHTVGDVVLARSKLWVPQSTRQQEPQLGGHPVLAVSESVIELRDVDPDEPLPTEVIEVYNEGAGELDWTVETDADWVRLEKEPGCFRIVMEPRPGNNRAAIRVRDRGSGGSKTVRLHVRVLERDRRPSLALSATDVDFGSLSLGAKSPRRSVLLRNTGGGELDAEVGATPDWLVVHRLDEAIDLLVDTSQPGDFAAAVPVHSAGGDATIGVRAHVMPGPVLEVLPTNVLLAPGAAEAQLVRVDNRGSGTLEWQYGTTGDFFSAERVAEGLRVVLRDPAGQQHGSIWIRSNGGEVTLDVRATPAPTTQTIFPPVPGPPARATRHRYPVALIAVLTAALLVAGLVLLLPRGQTAGTQAQAQPPPKATSMDTSPPNTNAAPPSNTTAAPPPTAAVPPEEVVRAYYDAINVGDYQTAWGLVGGNKFGQTYQQFAAGFASTAHDELTIEGVNGNTVTITLVATQNDGTTQRYQGTYTIQGRKIVDASLRRVG